jgi:alpha-tubulin suppressor-like RCC1 family protein
MNAMKRKLSGVTGLLVAVGWIAACSSSNGTKVGDAGTDANGSPDSSKKDSEPSTEGGPDAGPDGDGSSDGDSAPESDVSDSPSDGDGSGEADAPDADADATPNPDGAISVSVGGGNACALTRGGAVECWVDGFAAPAAVVAGLASGVTAVSAGGNSTSGIYGSYGDFACAINAAGGVECWGDVYSDGTGALGNGSNTPSSVPGTVTGLTSGVTALSAGAGDVLAACAVAGGVVECWGNNAGNPVNGLGPGVLGNGTSAASSSVPVEIIGFTGTVTAVSVGNSFACAIAGGGVWCWGNNGAGQLGNNSTTNSAAPVQVTGLASGVTAVSAGDEAACAITASGAVECWGNNTAGQLGNGSDAGSSLVPVQVTGLTSGVTAVTTAAGTACAITASGAVECWGNNAGCELGNNSTASSPIPVPVTTLTSGVTALSVGDGFACAVTSDGGVWCWGTVNVNSEGEGVAPECVPIHVTGFPG